MLVCLDMGTIWPDAMRLKKGKLTIILKTPNLFKNRPYRKKSSDKLIK